MNNTVIQTLYDEFAKEFDNSDLYSSIIDKIKYCNEKFKNKHINKDMVESKVLTNIIDNNCEKYIKSLFTNNFVDTKPLSDQKRLNHELFNGSNLLYESSTIPLTQCSLSLTQCSYYKIKSKNIQKYVNICCENRYLRNIGDIKIYKNIIYDIKQFYLYQSNIRSEFLYIVENNDRYYCNINSYQLHALSECNIDIICLVRYNVNQYEIDLIAEHLNDQQSVDYRLSSILNDKMVILKSVFDKKYKEHLTIDENPIRCDYNIDRFYSDIVFIIKDEALNDIKTIDMLIHLNIIKFNNIFDKINKINKDLLDKDQDNIISKEVKTKAYNNNCFIFIYQFGQSFRNILTDSLMNDNIIDGLFEKYHINKLQTRSVIISSGSNGVKILNKSRTLKYSKWKK